MANITLSMEQFNMLVAMATKNNAKSTRKSAPKKHVSAKVIRKPRQLSEEAQTKLAERTAQANKKDIRIVDYNEKSWVVFNGKTEGTLCFRDKFNELKAERKAWFNMHFKDGDTTSAGWGISKSAYPTLKDVKNLFK